MATILCSACIDLHCAKFDAIIPQSECAECGRKCLGYLVKQDEEE